MADGIKSTFNKGVTALNVKTTALLETAKLKTHIGTLNSEIDRLTVDLGRAVYQAWLAGAPAETEPLCESIREKQLEIEELQQKMKEIEQEGKRILGAKEAKNPAAPSVLPPPVPPVPPVSAVPPVPPVPPAAPAPVSFQCPACGALYSSAINFCTRCGSKMQG